MHSQFRLKNHLLLVALATAYPMVSYAAGAARIEFVSGNVVALTPAGVQRPLSRGAELMSGEAIRTGDNARAQLKFSDGAMMSLQPQTEFRIDDYNYSGKADGGEKGFFSLVKGGLRTITGLIGKGQRDNYRLSTTVATIGIRGTEYSAQFSGGQDGVLNLATGEGRVEVCNAGGCVIVSGGESAIVTGSTKPTLTAVKPTLSAAPVTNSQSPQLSYSAVENVDGTGVSKTVASGVIPMVSGPGYTLAAAGQYNSSPGVNYFESGTAKFDSASRLTDFIGSFDTLQAGSIGSTFTIDGILGWGVWSSGTMDGDSGMTSLTDIHYIVGKPTDSSELSALASGNITATYSLIGYTAPTSNSVGGVGSNVQADLSINFGTATSTLAVSTDFAGTNYSASNVTASLNLSTGTMAGGSGSLSYSGFVAGANASYAGIAYTLDASVNGTLSGALAFKKQ